MTDRPKAGRRLLESGSYALRARNASKAREAFEGALTVFAGPDMGLARGHALRGLGEAAALQQDPERAARLLDHAATEYRWLATLLDELPLDDVLRERSRIDALEGEAITRVLKANLALSRGDVRGAAEGVNEAYPLFQRAGKPPSIGNLWDATARVAFWEGRVPAAIRAWERALATVTDEGDLRARCLTCLRLADAYLAAGRLEEAKARLEDADELVREFEEAGVSGRVYFGWGSWYARHDQFEAALDAWDDALRCFQDAGDRELEVNTLVRAARVASRSGRAEVVSRLRDALHLLDRPHPSALGVILAVIAEHALDVGRPEIALVAVASARRFWGDREPLQGWAPLLRLEARALAGVGSTRAAVTVVHHLAALAGERHPSLLKLREAWRRQAPAAWLAQLDDLEPDVLAAQADAMLLAAVGPWCARTSLPEDKLGTVPAALTLCDRLHGEISAVIAVDDRSLQELRPTLVWESAASERQETPLPEGVTTVGRGPDNDVAIPWDAEMAEVHCTLQRSGSVVRLVDGGTDGGTFVDGGRVDERVLEGGERIEIGETIFRFQLRSAPVGYGRGAEVTASGTPALRREEAGAVDLVRGYSA